MPNQNITKKKLKAIVFTDIVDFTKLSSEDEQQALNLIQKQNDTLKPIVKKHNGKWLKEIGDGLLFSFDSSLEAVRCSIEIQKELSKIDELIIRIGIHQGDIFIKDGDIFGDDVNIASRIESFAPHGGIAISDKIHKDISSVSDLKTSFIGYKKLKGVEQETKIRCITSNDLPKHKKQILPLAIGYYGIIQGIINSILTFGVIIHAMIFNLTLHYIWMMGFIIDFSFIFIGYSALSYARGISMKSQRLFVFLGYFIIIISILSTIAALNNYLFTLPEWNDILIYDIDTSNH